MESPKRHNCNNEMSSFSSMDLDIYSFVSPLPGREFKKRERYFDFNFSPEKTLFLNLNETEDVGTPPNSSRNQSPVLNTPNFNSVSSFKKLISRLELSKYFSDRLQRLGWIGEQLLYDDIEDCNNMIKRKQEFCSDNDIKRLKEFRDGFIEKAISSLETASFRTVPYVGLSETSLAALKQFNELAESFDQAKYNQDTTHNLKVNPEVDVAGLTDKNILTNMVVSAFEESNDEILNGLSINYENSLDISSNINKIAIYRSTDSTNLSETSQNTNLYDLLLQIIQRESVASLSAILTNPITNEYIESCEKSKKKNKKLMFSPSLCCVAKIQLGKILNMIVEHGANDTFLNLLEKKKLNRETSKINNAIENSEKSYGGSLNLMGSKSVRRGHYTSRKTMRMQIQKGKKRSQKIKKKINNKNNENLNE